MQFFNLMAAYPCNAPKVHFLLYMEINSTEKNVSWHYIVLFTDDSIVVNVSDIYLKPSQRDLIQTKVLYGF